MSMLNDPSTPLSLLATRRSGKPRDLIAPGPDAAQLAQILTIAARTPDHGKLAPWRFVDRRRRPARRAGAASSPTPIAPNARRRPGWRSRRSTSSRIRRRRWSSCCRRRGPTAISRLWEQELSAGAACMNLLHAAHAMGFAGGWLTGWPAFSDTVRDAFGAAPERIAGFHVPRHARQAARRTAAPRPATRSCRTWGG